MIFSILITGMTGSCRHAPRNPGGSKGFYMKILELYNGLAVPPWEPADARSPFTLPIRTSPRYSELLRHKECETAPNCTKVQAFCTYVNLRALASALVRQNQKIWNDAQTAHSCINMGRTSYGEFHHKSQRQPGKSFAFCFVTGLGSMFS